MGTLVRTTITCETCHRTLSSTMGVAGAEPVTEEAVTPEAPAEAPAPVPEPAAASPKPAPKAVAKPRAAKTSTAKPPASRSRARRSE
jgi:hypothetical protein